MLVCEDALVSDSPEPFWPGSREVEALVSRAVAERVDPLRSQLTAVGRALAILAERVALPEQFDDLTSRVDALTERVEGALATLESVPGQLDTVPQAVAAALGEGPDQGDVRRGLQLDDIRDVVAEAVDEALARTRAETRDDGARLLERVTSLETAMQAGAEGRDEQTDVLRQALAVAVTHAVAKLDQGRGVETDRVLEKIGDLQDTLGQDGLQTVLTAAVDHAVDRAVAGVEASHAAATERILDVVAAQAREAEAHQTRAGEFHQTVTNAIEQAVVWVEGAVTTDGARILDQVAALEHPLTRVFEQVAALEGPLTRDAIARQAQLDELRHTVASTIDQAVNRIEAGRATDASQLRDQIAGMVARAEDDARRRDDQAVALLAAVDDRLQALHVAGVQASKEREVSLAARLEAITAEHGQVLLGRIDERTAAITELAAIPPMVAAEVERATAGALGGQVEPLVARLVEAVDSLAHEGGRIEALARSHAGEARAVEERVTAMFVEVAERAESAVDRSRARISEGQVALGGRFEATVGELMSALQAAAERIETRLAETADGLRAAGGHQNGALLDAVTRSSQLLGEGLTEVRAALIATGTESAARVAEGDRRAEALADRIEALRSTVESMRHDPRLEALVVEQVAARDAQLAAIQAVSARIDEVGPLVARALLTEVERAVRAANAAEEAVSSLRPDTLRAALSRASDRAAEEVEAATRRFDQAIAALAEQVGGQLSALAHGQARAHDELAAIVRSPGASADRLDQLDRSLAEALGELGGVVAATRVELVTLTGRALDRTSAVADEVARTSGTAIEDLRASQTVLREAVQDGAHKAELTAIDIRGLRDRLTPHLVALAEATTRRAEADQAGFDAVLARLDQLLAPRVR